MSDDREPRFARGGLIEGYHGTDDVPIPRGGCGYLISAAMVRRLADEPEMRAALDRIRDRIESGTG